jgi:ribonuclease HII
MVAMKTIPSYNLEKKLLNTIDLVFGMDEVGRGSFAGPLVAAAVAFKNEFEWFSELNDSKLLTPTKREQLSKLILENAICVIEKIEVVEIDKLGIGKCNQQIFKKLIDKVLNEYSQKKVHFLIDGAKQDINIDNLDFIIKGDSKIISIAAASIVAKVFRDKLMTDLEEVYKGYDFVKNKGYGSKFHRDAIKKLGLCNIHRKSFSLSKFL